MNQKAEQNKEEYIEKSFIQEIKCPDSEDKYSELCRDYDDLSDKGKVPAFLLSGSAVVRSANKFLKYAQFPQPQQYFPVLPNNSRISIIHLDRQLHQPCAYAYRFCNYSIWGRLLNGILESLGGSIPRCLRRNKDNQFVLF